LRILRLSSPTCHLLWSYFGFESKAREVAKLNNEETENGVRRDEDLCSVGTMSRLRLELGSDDAMVGNQDAHNLLQH
jgi:hypothetical protein